jgi:hypothetical protein
MHRLLICPPDASSPALWRHVQWVYKSCWVELQHHLCFLPFNSCNMQLSDYKFHPSHIWEDCFRFNFAKERWFSPGTPILLCCKGPFPLNQNFHGQNLFRKYHCVENFQLQIFFSNENLCRPITFYKIFLLQKIFPSGNEPLHWTKGMVLTGPQVRTVLNWLSYPV